MSKIIELKTTGQRARVRDAQQSRQLVRVWRENLEHGSFCGYVVDVGREFMLLWVLADNVSYDGLYAMRHRDISELEAPERHHGFLEKAIAVKQIVPQAPRGFPLDTIREVVQAAGATQTVIGVHVDSEEESEVCYIGHLISTDDDGFLLQELSPDAEWMREASFFSWDEVSTISMEDGYAQALLAVAGNPPPLLSGDSGVGRL